MIMNLAPATPELITYTLRDFPDLVAKVKDPAVPFDISDLASVFVDDRGLRVVRGANASDNVDQLMEYVVGADFDVATLIQDLVEIGSIVLPLREEWTVFHDARSLADPAYGMSPTVVRAGMNAVLRYRGLDPLSPEEDNVLVTQEVLKGRASDTVTCIEAVLRARGIDPYQAFVPSARTNQQEASRTS